MKKVIRAASLLGILSVLILSCKKEAGPQGEPGRDGNANIVAYTFTNQTFTGLLNLTLPNLRTSFVDSSIVLVYFNPSTEVATAWYPVPGIGSGGLYDTRYALFSQAADEYRLAIRTLRMDGTSYPNALTFTKIRVFFAKAESIISLRTSENSQPLDYNDYSAVCRYYGIEE